MAELSAKEAAIQLGTDARTFRKFMRSITPKEEQPGQGNRYAIDSRKIRKLKTQFEDWNTPKPKTEKKAKKVIDEVILEDFEFEDARDELDDDESEVFEDALDLLDDLEPTDDEIADVDMFGDIEELGADVLDEL